MPYSRSRCSRRSGRGWLATTCAGLDQLAAEQPGDHRLGHDAGADGRDRGLRQGGHRAEYSRGSGRPALGAGAPSRRRVATPVRKNRPVVVTRASAKPASAQRRLELAGLVVDLDDRELAAVVEAADGRVVGGRRVVGGARLRIRQRVDERERPAGLEPATDDRRGTSSSLAARDVAQPEAGEDGVDLPIGLGPRVAHVEVRPQACATSRSRARSSGAGVAVVERQLALDARSGDHQPVPAASSTISPRDRQRVEPAPGGVELGVPGRVVDRARARSGRGAGTSRRTRGRGPRSRRASSASMSRPAGRAGGGRRDGRGLRARPRVRVARRGRRARARSAPGAAGSAGTRCRRPCRRSRDRAAPSPRGRPARGRRARVPHHRQSKVARNGTGARAYGVDRRPRPERRDVDERVGVEDLGQQLDAVDDPRARAG